MRRPWPTGGCAKRVTFSGMHSRCVEIIKCQNTLPRRCLPIHSTTTYNSKDAKILRQIVLKSPATSGLSSGQKSELRQPVAPNPPPPRQINKYNHPMRLPETCYNKITDSKVARVPRQFKLFYRCHTYPNHWSTTPKYTHIMAVTDSLTLHIAVNRLPNTGMVSTIPCKKYSYRIHCRVLVKEIREHYKVKQI